MKKNEDQVSGRKEHDRLFKKQAQHSSNRDPYPNKTGRSIPGSDVTNIVHSDRRAVEQFKKDIFKRIKEEK